MIRRALLILMLLAGGGVAMAKMSWPDLLGRPQPKPHSIILQMVQRSGIQPETLWLPEGRGPFPVVVMVHGGCWQKSIAKSDIMSWIADDLRKHGIAVWNIEYRGVDEKGGGYPGTFLDVAAGFDGLAKIAPEYHLDLRHIVAVGHSAGGHLALWAAAREHLPRTSPLYHPHPLPIAAVVSLGGLPDLEAARSIPLGICGGAPIIDKLVGKPSAARPDIYADTSPARMPAPTATIILINGALDPVAPPTFAAAYAATMQAKGKSVERYTIPDVGHVELITPGTAPWSATVQVIERELRRP